MTPDPKPVYPWPWWLVVLVLAMVTLAPLGLGAFMQNLSPRGLGPIPIVVFWLILTALGGIGLFSRRSIVRKVVLMIAAGLVLLNIGGCVSALSRIGGAF